MADGKEDKDVVKMDRRTWDKELYEKKALERLAALEAGEDPDKAEVDDASLFAEAPADIPRVPGSQRAFLQTRKKTINFDTLIGSKKVVTGADPLRAGGYHCPVCECSLKDSASYLDHINGKRHQRKLGFSMRVEASTVDQVRSRLEAHKNKRVRDLELATASAKAGSSEEANARAFAEYETRMRRQAEEEEAAAQAKKERKKARVSGATTAAAPQQDAGAGGNEDEEAMMAQMGFAGFGSSKKS